VSKTKLPRGPYALPPEVVAKDQRGRLLAAVPQAVAEYGYEKLTVGHVVAGARVSRRAFYNQFPDKRACFAAALEASHERLLGALTFRCYSSTTSEEKIEGGVEAVLFLLAAEPALARLVAVEALGAGENIARIHHQWLRRYVDLHPGLDALIVGGIASRIGEEVLAGRTGQLEDLRDELVTFALTSHQPTDPAVAA
jgi:TetR/AcrR family transcriptional regulator